jgi:hypothetical protein
MIAPPSGVSPLKKDHLAGGASRWRRCLSLTYAQYARSSRLASRAPRSAIWSFFSGGRATSPSQAWLGNGPLELHLIW